MTVREAGNKHNCYEMALLTSCPSIVNTNSGHQRGVSNLASPLGLRDFHYCITQKQLFVE